MQDRLMNRITSLTCADFVKIVGESNEYNLRYMSRKTRKLYGSNDTKG